MKPTRIYRILELSSKYVTVSINSSFKSRIALKLTCLIDPIVTFDLKTMLSMRFSLLTISNTYFFVEKFTQFVSNYV